MSLVWQSASQNLLLKGEGLSLSQIPAGLHYASFYGIISPKHSPGKKRLMQLPVAQM